MHERRNLDVLKVSAAEFQSNIGRYRDLALRQPVAVTRNGRESCVLLSTEEYRRLKRRDREVLGPSATSSPPRQASRARS
jgi:prevent-host-death family protein